MRRQSEVVSSCESRLSRVTTLDILLSVIACWSRICTFVFVQTAVEMQTLQNELDRGGHGGRVPTDIKFRDRVSDAVEMTELVDVVV